MDRYDKEEDQEEAKEVITNTIDPGECMYVYIWAYVCMYLCICVCIYMCMHVYICVYVYRGIYVLYEYLPACLFGCVPCLGMTCNL